MLEVQKYLRSGKTPDDLKDDLAINYRQHVQYPNLIGFKYNQLDSPKCDKIVIECRGLILDSDNDWEIVAHPFNRFFNYGEGPELNLDWDSATVQEKADGSLIIGYFYNDEFQVATSGSPSASGSPPDAMPDTFWNCNGEEIVTPSTFYEYFIRVLNTYSGHILNHIQHLPRDVTMMFELMGPLNRVVVPHKESKIVILGGRNIKTGQEIPAGEIGKMWNGYLPVIKEFPLQGIDDILASFKNFSGVEQEGYIILDKNYNRIKVKHPGYTALHELKGKFSTRACVRTAMAGETSEVEVVFPELADRLNEARSKFAALRKEIEADYDRIKHIENQKEFALKATKTRCSGALFSVRSGKYESIVDFLSNMHVDKIMKLLGYKNES